MILWSLVFITMYCKTAEIQGGMLKIALLALEKHVFETFFENLFFFETFINVTICNIVF